MQEGNKMDKTGCNVAVSYVDKGAKCVEENKSETEKEVTAKLARHFTNQGQGGHREGLGEEEGRERCFMALSCRQSEP